MGSGKSVSVIVPVFNAAGSLERSVRSLMTQTLSDLEIILVNDASTDASASIIHRLAEECSNIIYIELPENRGVHEARLAGLAAANAPWIGFLDADDIALPDMFESMYRAGVEKSVDIVACGSYRVTSNRKRLEPKVKYPENMVVSDDLFARFCSFEFGTGTIWNKLYRREIVIPLVNLYYPWRQNINEDLILSIGIFLNASSLYLMKDIFHEYVLTDGSVTSSLGKGKSFVETYRAYAIALNLYAVSGDVVAQNICSLYRRQFDFPSYRVASLEEVYPHKERLQEAVDLVSKSYPPGLAMIVPRNVRTSNVKRVARTVFKKIRVLAPHWGGD